MHAHEQAVANEFNAFLHRAAAARGQKIFDFSLGGQDRHAAADYLLSDTSHFALIEFKFRESNLRDEARKPRRLTLCRRLPTRPDMQDLHDQCHFIAWADLAMQAMWLNIYRHEICNRQILGQSSALDAHEPSMAHRQSAEGFAHDFLVGTPVVRALELEPFERYLRWLMYETSGSAATTVELLTSDPTRPDALALVLLPSLNEAHAWMQRHKPRPAPSDAPTSAPRPH